MSQAHNSERENGEKDEETKQIQNQYNRKLSIDSSWVTKKLKKVNVSSCNGIKLTVFARFQWSRLPQNWGDVEPASHRASSGHGFGTLDGFWGEED